MPDQASQGQRAGASTRPSLLEPGTMPATNGGLLMLGAVIAVTLLASRSAAADQAVAASTLTAAADAYRKAENKLITAIIEADKNDVGRNEIARRVDGIYSRQTVLSLLGSADLVQRSARALEADGLAGDIRIWQGKRQRLLMELADMERADDARLRTSQAAVQAMAKAGIGTRAGGGTSPASHLAAGKVIELIPSPENSRRRVSWPVRQA
jgi:hypothetical protein